MNRSIPVITHSVNNKVGPTFYKILQISSVINSTESKKIILDFEGSNFLNITAMSGLYGILRTYEEQGKEVEYINVNNHLNAFFEHIHFYNGLNIDVNITKEQLEIYRSKSFMPFFKFDTQSLVRDKAVNILLQIIQIQTNISGIYQMAIDYIITEFANNIAEHSNGNFGIVTAQCYPSIGFFDISILDNGVGLYNSYLNTRKFFPESEVDAIKMAVNGKSTKDVPDSRGFGISTSSKMITRGLNGTLLLWSGKAAFVQTKDYEDTIIATEESFYQGCYVFLRIPLKMPDDFDFYMYVGG